MIRLFTFFITLLLSYPIGAHSLSTAEQKIIHFINENQQQQLSLLEKVVNINSGTSHVAGVIQVGEIFKKEFENLGFQTKWVEELKEMHKAPTLIAEMQGKQGKKILLIGHLDTVFAKEHSFERHGNIAKGSGVVDDKGGDVVLLYALSALKAAGVLNDVSISVVLTGDEEDSGKPTSISRKPLIDIAHHSDVALDFEEAISVNTATIARRGISNWILISHGKQAHSAGIFNKGVGYGAIFEMSRILNAIRKKLYLEKYASFNPGRVIGGTTVDNDKEQSISKAYGKQNVVAESALATGDLRFLTATQKQGMEKIITSIVNNHLRHTDSSITFQDAIPSMPPSLANLQLLKQYGKASIDLGYGPVRPLDPGLRGAGDISHVAAFVPANLAGLGPIGFGTHSEQESLEINSLTIQTKRAALLIYRLTR